MRGASRFAGISALVMACGLVPTHAQTVQTASSRTHAISAMRKYLRTLDAAGEFSGTVLVAQRGVPILQEGYGFADRAWQIRNTAESAFKIGSISKQFTALGILLLESEGRLSVMDPICKYLKDCPAWWYGITIQQALTHVSGIPDVVRVPGFEHRMTTPTTLDGTIGWVRDLPLDFKPGSQFQYGNTGYLIAARIIEIVSGMPFDSYMRSRVYDRLGLRHTAYAENGKIFPHEAQGYVVRGGVWEHAPYIDMTIPIGAGSELSTVGDFLLYDRALDGDGKLPSSVVTAMFSDYGHEYGYGWEVTHRFDQRLLAHVGDINGFGSYVARYPESHVLVVVLSNRERAPVRQINDSLASLTLRAR